MQFTAVDGSCRSANGQPLRPNRLPVQGSVFLSPHLSITNNFRHLNHNTIGTLHADSWERGRRNDRVKHRGLTRLHGMTTLSVLDWIQGNSLIITGITIIAGLSASMKIKEPDILELSNWFELALNQSTRLERKEKMRMRRKIRDELYTLLAWEKPTADIIIHRWEERLDKVFKVMPSNLKDDLFRLLKKKLTIPQI